MLPNTRAEARLLVSALMTRISSPAQTPHGEHAYQVNDDKDYTVPKIEQVSARTKRNVFAMTWHEILLADPMSSVKKRTCAAIQTHVQNERQEIHHADNKPAKPSFLSASLGCETGNLASQPHAPED